MAQESIATQAVIAEYLALFDEPEGQPSAHSARMQALIDQHTAELGGKQGPARWHMIDYLKRAARKLGLTVAGNGIDKVAVFSECGDWVYKFDTTDKPACALEVQAVQEAEALGLPVAHAERVSSKVSRMEVCTPLSTLAQNNAAAYTRAVAKVPALAEALKRAVGVYDEHDGNWGVRRRDRAVVCIDLSHVDKHLRKPA